MKTITPIPCLKDNYAWLLPGAHGQAAIVDPGEYDSVARHLQSAGTRLASILVTHLHSDHINGISQLVRDYPSCRVWGPLGTPCVTDIVSEGSLIDLFDGELVISTWHTPGHSPEHLSFILEDSIFCGDTLFSGGCGRATSGGVGDLFASIKRIDALPSSTLVYCGHEYTAANLLFAERLLAENQSIRNYLESVRGRRERGEPSLPTLLAQERQINLFLRCYEDTVKEALQPFVEEPLTSEFSTFAELRRLKDRWR